MEDLARMIGQPFPDLGMLVGGVVVCNGMDYLTRWQRPFDRIEEFDEFEVDVLGHAAANDGAVEDVEGSEQGRGAIPLIVVGHRAAPSRLQRQTRLLPVESLDLALLVNRNDDGMGRWVNVEAGDIADFGGKVRIVGQFELTPALRLQAAGTPIAVDQTDADADEFGHRRSCPMGDLTRWLAGDGQRHHAFGCLVTKRPNAGLSGFVTQQPIDPIGHEPVLPTPDCSLALPGPAHDFDRPQTVGRQQHDPRLPDVLLWTVAIRPHRFHAAPVGGIHFNDDPFAHPPDSHNRSDRGTQCRTLLLAFNH